MAVQIIGKIVPVAVQATRHGGGSNNQCTDAKDKKRLLDAAAHRSDDDVIFFFLDLLFFKSKGRLGRPLTRITVTKKATKKKKVKN
jgi:hypothetical protein